MAKFPIWMVMERYGATEDGGWEAVWHFKWWYVPIWYLRLLFSKRRTKE